jgi:hypothetical protein
VAGGWRRSSRFGGRRDRDGSIVRPDDLLCDEQAKAQTGAMRWRVGVRCPTAERIEQPRYQRRRNRNAFVAHGNRGLSVLRTQ